MDADQLSFTGFLSYSHADLEFAQALFARLTQYRLPKNATPNDQRRLGRFFMDRETMPASGSLSDEIVSAISRSESLIVVCSPNSAKSRWVDLEIDAFRTHRPQGQVLCAVVGGDPSQLQGELSPFPPNLILDGHAPLAADFRKSGDGFRLAFLKLAATLSGASLPALTRVDDARRSRRMIYATTVSGLVATGMTGLAIYAFTARSEANERKQAAENLVEFMVGDLRDRLADVGRLDVLKGVSEKVVEHYQALPGQKLDCDELIRLGKAYDLATEVAINAGDPGMTKSFAAAGKANAQGLKQSCPDSLEALFQTGQSAFWSGYAALTIDDMESAERDISSYYNTLSKLVDIAPQDTTYRMEFAAAGMTLGTVAYQQGNYVEAEDRFNNACSRYEELLNESRSDPDRIRNLANCNGWHSLSLVMQDKFDEARRTRQQEIELVDELVTNVDPPDWIAVYTLASSHRSLARIYFLMGDYSEATRIAEIAYSNGQRLVSHDPQNGEWLYTHARTVALVHEIAKRTGSADITDIGVELARLSEALPSRHQSSPDELIASLQLH